MDCVSELLETTALSTSKEEKKQQVPVLNKNTKHRPRHPSIGPEPLTLTRKQVDGLYDMLEILTACLDQLNVHFTLIAGV